MIKVRELNKVPKEELARVMRRAEKDISDLLPAASAAAMLRSSLKMTP